MKVRKLHCYIDESGQDPQSKIFIIVAIVTDKDQARIRDQVLKIESQSGTGRRKWHKSRHNRRIKYLSLLLEKEVAKGEIFFGTYEKPLPYFLPMLQTIEQALIKKANKKYRATVYVDGIDKKKARELTNALRIRGISLNQVRGRRDESEPLIRLADMWAGCIRKASLDADYAKGSESDIMKKAIRLKHIIDVSGTK